LRDDWERAAGEAWAPACRERHQIYDFAVAPRAVTPDLVHDLRQLEPFGQGNPQPLLRTGPLRLRRPPRPFGKGHLSAECESDDGARIELVGWSWARRADDLQGRFEVLAHAEIDTWHGGAVLRLVDCRPV
jgi:single-stranded-DNA-specific exonuclease